MGFVQSILAAFTSIFSGGPVAAQQIDPRFTFQKRVDGPYRLPIRLIRLTCLPFERRNGSADRTGVDKTGEAPCFKLRHELRCAIESSWDLARKSGVYSELIMRENLIVVGRFAPEGVTQEEWIFPFPKIIHHNISQKHFELRLDEDGMLWITDLNSLNGTAVVRQVREGYELVNLAPCQSIPLYIGDHILLSGEHLLQVQAVTAKN